MGSSPAKNVPSFRQIDGAGELSPNFGRTRKETSNQKQSASMRASWERRKQRDQEIEWALAPYTLE